MVCGERDTELQHRVPEETERGQDKGTTVYYQPRGKTLEEALMVLDQENKCRLIVIIVQLYVSSISYRKMNCILRGSRKRLET